LNDIQFGLGLVTLGRRWGFRERRLPTAGEAIGFLEAAVALGVRLFDTAPSYGAAGEALLGEFLREHLPGTTVDRASLTVATKCGEHWDEARDEPYVDQSFDALRRSIDRSLERLGRVDVLQLHKATVEAIQSDGVAQAWDYARSCGIPVVGASVKDPEALRAALEDTRIGVIQFPYNRSATGLEEAFAAAASRGKALYVNRPLGMGRLMYDESGATLGLNAAREAYRFVLRHPFRGAVLTGTLSTEHLKQNLESFRSARG
jgi:aryl-alcohol dehydrogenase-like predicted oxidoreductase